MLYIYIYHIYNIYIFERHPLPKNNGKNVKLHPLERIYCLLLNKISTFKNMYYENCILLFEDIKCLQCFALSSFFSSPNCKTLPLLKCTELYLGYIRSSGEGKTKIIEKSKQKNNIKANIMDHIKRTNKQQWND